MAGDNLYAVGADMLRLSKTLDVIVESVWNGTTVWSYPSDDDPSTVYNRYLKNLEIKSFNK